MADKIKFWPLRGTYDQIMKQPYYDGKIYFAYDTNQIILDVKGSKHIMGGGGSSAAGSGIIYAHGSEEEIAKVLPDNDEDFSYIIPMAVLDNSVIEPPVDGLILNSDGRFFRVVSVDSDTQMINALLLAVSGSGGSGSGPVEQDLFVEYTGIDQLGSTYIYGQENSITFTPRSTVDAFVSYSFIIIDLDDPEKKPLDALCRTGRLYNGDTFTYDTSILPAKENLQISFTITSSNSRYNRGKGLTITFSPIRVLEIYVSKPKNIAISIAETSTSLRYIPYFNGLGDTTTPVKVHYAVDGTENEAPKSLVAAISDHEQYLTIPMQPHGMHVITVWLTVTISGQEYKSAETSYEIPFVERDNETPIIWVKNELGTIVNYEPAVIQYMVYSSVAQAQGAPVEVSLYYNSELLNTEEVYYASGSWLSMDLTPYYEFTSKGYKVNNFSLVCGSASKTISFTVDDEHARDLSLVHNDVLKMNFDSIGRSNKEIRANRSKWVSKSGTPYEATLSGFNWYTNGWMNDNDNMGSYLSVANGASVSFPIPLESGENAMVLNTNDKPWSFEVRFRIRNAKKFATLVSETPLYKYWMPPFTYDSDGNVNGGVVNEKGQEQDLQWINDHGYVVKLDSDGNKEMEESNTTKKSVEDKKYIAMKFLNSNKEGFAIGTQEAYFNTAGSTVNVKYKENEIINITFVIDHANDALSIYLNGILSGVGSLAAITPVNMDSSINFEISSKYCDFDLYKFRIYPTALTMPDVIHNYISDIKDISIYDENQLTTAYDATLLDYHALVKYNQDHPDTPTMPYAVIDMTKTDQGTDLPHYKGAKRKVRIEFTNPVADYYLDLGADKGGISQFRYYTHCPSFTADNVELNVQGTSSQKYPRRNFKAKFKKSKNWIYTKGELKDMPVFGSPIQNGEDVEYENYILSSGETLTPNWHVDHDTIGSNAFTWKIDYMESSGSYNTGFVNLMGSGVYNKHPLEDLHLSGVNASDYRVNVYGFPMLVFHKTGEDEYTYIGRYNMNLDKSSNERYGFELKKEQPYLPADPEIGKRPTIKDISECWELRDNQGTWCSWRYPTAEMRALGFNARMLGSTESEPRLEVAQHFEARYHKNADQFEYAQNIILNKENTDDFSADIGGDTPAAASAYVYNKLSNLQVLFNWLDSTDTNPTAITNEPFASPRRQLVNAKLTQQVKNPDFVYEDYILDPKNYKYPEYISVEDSAAMAENGVTYETVVENGVQRTYGIFTKDSREYRRQKFYSEFDKHLDLHYCCVYFVMTELMLCYDSRGKNMMIASWGPREEGGDYIWYPIFYDVDTQLGLNNVGAKLWDYDEDCSENGTFSTKDSVLWVNLYDVFKNNIMSTYRTLRNGKIDQTTIENAYKCKAGTTFDSYAMMGKRPIVAIGLDEYYKYVLPVTKPWKNQEGKMVTANYLYACQGDRILSRELLIENRLLYMDSKWLGGAFGISTGGMAGANFRSTGNKPSTSSDIYLNGKKWSAVDNAYIDDPTIHYPVKYYDAVPEYRVTPYLNFYVTTFVDENTFQTPEAYDEHNDEHQGGVPTVISPSVKEGYISGKVDQQLNYFAGSAYISSFGDLSLKYLNEIHFPNTERLLDITLGSDAPGYFNAETLNPLELYTEVNVDGTVKPGHEKPLLQKINLTNVRGVNTYLDVRSPSKLEEFRALGTSLRYALFANGAPLNTVHLPGTVTRLVFTQNKELKKIITDTPVVADMVNGELVYRPHESYEGLFVDGVTNYTSDMAGTGSLITELSFEGDALGYGSYTILKNVVDRKYGTGRANRLSIRMADVTWTPYVQVEYGEEKLNNVTYYLLTDHSTYEIYDRADDYWYEDTLNGKVYTYNPEMDESIIQDLSLFKLFYDDKNNTPSNEINQFTNNIESMLNQQTYPTISGEVYISNANGPAIKESDLTDKYGVAFPNLKIRVANVEPAYIAKYIQILDSGKEDEVDIIRYPHEEGMAVTVTKKVPYKQYCDFLGWSISKNPTVDSDWLVKYNNETKQYEDILNPQIFTEERNVIVLYAIFQEHPYVVSFKAPDGKVLTTSTSTYGKPANAPALIPSIDDKYEASLALTETYKFKGFSKEMVPLDAPDRVIEQSLVDLNSVYITHDTDLWVVFKKQDVHAEPLSSDYFVFTTRNYREASIVGIYDPDTSYNLDGVKIDIKPGVHLKGKVTLPSYAPDGSPVVSIGTTFASASRNNNLPWPQGSIGGGDITHIFWYQEESKPCQLRMTEPYSLCGPTSGTGNLKYFEFPSSFRFLNDFTFFSCNSLLSLELNEGIIAIGASAVNNAFINKKDYTIPLVKIPSSLNAIGQYGFVGIECVITSLQFGEQGKPSHFQYANGIDYSESTDVKRNIFTGNKGSVGTIVFFPSSAAWSTAIENALKNNGQNTMIFSGLTFGDYSVMGVS